VLLEDGSTLLRSRRTESKLGNLPAVGGDDLNLEELRIADTEFGEDGPVRAARLRTVRQRIVKTPPKAKKGKQPEITQPQQMVFDLRAVVSRASVDEQMARLGWYLIGGYPIALALALVGGILLIRKAVRPVESAFDRERRFTSAVSHELRTPLTAIRGEIELALRRERTSSEYADTLLRVQPVVTRMSDMVEGLLILARSKAGHLLHNAGEVSLANLRKSTEEVIGLLPGRERVTIVGAGTDGATIVGDSLLLALALRNLVENALHYAPQSPVQVHIETNSPNGAVLRVEDQGPGIPASVLGQLDTASSESQLNLRPDGSLSLGLSIARAIAEAHGGTLSFTNRPDAGCVAEVVLPIVGDRAIHRA